jgi:D-alanine-D-alanine ligase
MNPVEMFEKLKLKKIAVVYGGPAIAGVTVINAVDRPVKSYESTARDIGRSLFDSGFAHVSMIAESMDLAARLKADKIDLVWLNSGGVQGEGARAHAAAACEIAGVPYVGHCPSSACRLDDKSQFKDALLAVGLPTAAYWLARGGTSVTLDMLVDRLHAKPEDGPFVVKPVSGRASLNVYVAQTLADVPAIIQQIRSVVGRKSIIVEQFLGGAEYAVAVDCGRWAVRGCVARRGRETFAFSAVERVLPAGEQIFASMDLRQITTDRMRPVYGQVRAQLLDLARSVASKIGIGTAVRLDIRADDFGRLHILECNPKPDLTAPSANKTSLMCGGLDQEGMTYDDLIQTILINRLDYLMTYHPALIQTLQDADYRLSA